MYEIDARAPVIYRGSIRVAAPATKVWSLLSNIDSWPSWNPDVRSARLSGALQPGSTFVWQAGPGTITSTLHCVLPEHEIAWTGDTMGIRAVHVWRLEREGDETIVATEESWSGFLPWLLRGAFRQILEKSVEAGLAAIKEAAEKDERT